MLRKICPVCEQVMTSSHYCKVCRKFVKTPYEREITYYLNESHPAGETNCDYHGRTSEREKRNYTIKQPVNRNRNVKIAGIAIGILILVIMIPAVVLPFYLMSRSRKDMELEYEETEEFEFQMIEDEEAKAAGEHCSGEEHFSVTGYEMDSEISRILENTGYIVEEEVVHSSNSVYGSGRDKWTLYSTEKNYYLNSLEGGSYDVITIDYDTVTDELHRVNIYLKDIDAAASMMEQVVDVLAEAGEVPDSEYDKIHLKEELLGAYLEQEEESDGYWFDISDGEKGIDMYVGGDSDGIYITLWKTY